MVIPSIYCCHSCVCSDNDIDIDFDFDDSDDEENKPLIQNEKNNTNNTKRKIKKHKGKKKDTIFYFYSKYSDTNINKISISVDELCQYIKNLNIGKINKIQVKVDTYKNLYNRPIDKCMLNNINYIKVSYKFLYSKSKKYFNIPVINEHIITLFLNNPYQTQYIITSPSLNNMFEYKNKPVFYNIERCYSCDYMFWMSSTKPTNNEQPFKPSSAPINVYNGNNENNDFENNNEYNNNVNNENNKSFLNLPSSQPIDVPIVKKDYGTISFV